jgi:hypothetical protein
LDRRSSGRRCTGEGVVDAEGRPPSSSCGRKGGGAAGADAAAQSPPAAASPLLGISRRGRTGQAATSAAGESPGKAQLGPFRWSRVILDAQPAGQPIGLRGWRWGSGLGSGIWCAQETASGLASSGWVWSGLLRAVSSDGRSA